MEGPKKPKAHRIVSVLTREGALIETIQVEADGPTSLAIALNGNITVVPQWSAGGIQYVPVPSMNNLIKHKALKLPGGPQEYESTKGLVDDIIAYASRYVVLSPAFAAIAATYVLLSWVYDAFNELPYLRFRGDYGSGKTRALIVFGSITYKGFFASGASTISPIFHTLDRFRGTLIFDEADFRFTDEKAELVKIFNNGNVKGFSVLRTQVGPSKEFEPRAYSVYGPKIVAMRGSYEDRALESRFLTEEMSNRGVRGFPISLPVTQEAEARELRSKLLMYRFRERARVQIEPDFVDPDLEPRLNQVLLPLLSIAPTEEIISAIWNYADRMQAGAIVDRSNSLEGQVLAVIAAVMRSEARTTVPLREIMSAFDERFGRDYDRPIVNRRLGGIIRTRLGLPMYKSNGVMVVSFKDRDRLAAIFKHYGVDESEWKRPV